MLNRSMKHLFNLLLYLFILINSNTAQFSSCFLSGDSSGHSSWCGENIKDEKDIMNDPKAMLEKTFEILDEHSKAIWNPQTWSALGTLIPPPATLSTLGTLAPPLAGSSAEGSETSVSSSNTEVSESGPVPIPSDNGLSEVERPQPLPLTNRINILTNGASNSLIPLSTFETNHNNLEGSERFFATNPQFLQFAARPLIRTEAQGPISLLKASKQERSESIIGQPIENRQQLFQNGVLTFIPISNNAPILPLNTNMHQREQNAQMSNLQQSTAIRTPPKPNNAKVLLSNDANTRNNWLMAGDTSVLDTSEENMKIIKNEIRRQSLKPSRLSRNRISPKFLEFEEPHQLDQETANENYRKKHNRWANHEYSQVS